MDLSRSIVNRKLENNFAPETAKCHTVSVPKKRDSIPGDDLRDWMFPPELVGVYLRRARWALGWTVRQLESKSGVSHSELLRVELGEQECRLQTFVRLAAAMGLPAGRVIDDLVQCNSAVFAVRVGLDPAFNTLIKTLGVEDDRGVLSLRNFIANWATFAAQLLRYGYAQRQASRVWYPSDEARAAFLAFARRCDAIENLRRRLALQELLHVAPFSELNRHQIPVEAMAREFFEALPEKDMMTVPWNEAMSFPDFNEDMARERGGRCKKNSLTHTESSVIDASVKAQLPNLLEELKHATAAPGKKTELAKFLGAPLASVSRWLSGEREPGGETVLKMQAWLKRPT